MTSASASVPVAVPLSTQTTASGFPRSQNPVVTLLQKRRGLLFRLISVFMDYVQLCIVQAVTLVFSHEQHHVTILGFTFG